MRVFVAGVAAVAAGLGVPAAVAADGTGAEARRDFAVDGKLVPCRYDPAVLDDEIARSSDAAYTAALRAELPRAASAACGAFKPLWERGNNLFGGVRLVGVTAAGNASSERLRFRNVSGSARKLTSRLALTTSTGTVREVQFDGVPTLTIPPGGIATVRWGCRGAAKAPRLAGTTLYFCLDRGRGDIASFDVLPDGGAVVSVVGGDTALTRLGYGTKRGVAGF